VIYLPQEKRKKIQYYLLNLELSHYFIRSEARCRSMIHALYSYLAQESAIGIAWFLTRLLLTRHIRGRICLCNLFILFFFWQSMLSFFLLSTSQ